MSPRHRQKLSCYVDETGQDAASLAFVVVAVVTDDEQDALRHALIGIEQAAGTGRRKWHKSAPSRRLNYIDRVLGQSLDKLQVFYGSYPRPLPYFLPVLDVLEQAIGAKAVPPYTARIFVDGIDGKKALELTNALRLWGISLEQVRSRRNESEPLIRLADMRAGCIRAAATILPEGKPISADRAGLRRDCTAIVPPRRRVSNATAARLPRGRRLSPV